MHATVSPTRCNELPPRTTTPDHAGPAAPPAGAWRQLDSLALFGGEQEVRIEHFGQEYRLRKTRNGKLILTK